MEFRDLEEIVISDRWIDEYRREHISKAFEVRLKGGSSSPGIPTGTIPTATSATGTTRSWTWATGSTLGDARWSTM